MQSLGYSLQHFHNITYVSYKEFMHVNYQQVLRWQAKLCINVFVWLFWGKCNIYVMCGKGCMLLYGFTLCILLLLSMDGGPLSVGFGLSLGEEK